MDGTESIAFEIKLASNQHQSSPLYAVDESPAHGRQTKSGEVGGHISDPKGFPALKATALCSHPHETGDRRFRSCDVE